MDRVVFDGEEKNRKRLRRQVIPLADVAEEGARVRFSFNRKHQSRFLIVPRCGLDTYIRPEPDVLSERCRALSSPILL